MIPFNSPIRLYQLEGSKHVKPRFFERGQDPQRSPPKFLNSSSLEHCAKLDWKNLPVKLKYQFYGTQVSLMYEFDRLRSFRSLPIGVVGQGTLYRLQSGKTVLGHHCLTKESVFREPFFSSFIRLSGCINWSFKT